MVFLAFQLFQGANTPNDFISYYCKNSIQKSGEIKKLLLLLLLRLFQILHPNYWIIE